MATGEGNRKTVDLRSFLSPEDLANRVGEGSYYCIRSQAVNVLLIGRSQTGKSTIASNLIHPYSISRTDGYSTTTDPACIPITLSTPNNAENYNVNIIDTPGLYEKRLNVEEGRSDSELLKLAARCIEDNITFINVVCFVSIMGKTHELDVEVFDYVQEFLGPNYSANSMLLLTHCDQVGDDMIENYVRDITQNYEPTKKIIDYCKLGVKYFGTIDHDELVRWQHKPNILKLLVIYTLKRVEVWRNDLLKTFTECPPIATKELQAIINYKCEQKQQLQKTLSEETARKMEQQQKTMEAERLKERVQKDQQLKLLEDELTNLRIQSDKLLKAMRVESISGQPCGSLAELINAADKHSVISDSEILTRNSAVRRQLENEHLRTINVESDNNCYFRSLSVCIYGNEEHHASLRADVARHISEQAVTSSSADSAVLRKRAADIACDGFWPGEDVIAATANCLKRAIFVYLAAGSSSPICYEPRPIPSPDKIDPPLKVAFLEPGHYNAVLP